MGNNTFGNVLAMTTWGESHGPAIGVVIDGCPAGIELHEWEIQKALSWRVPGNNAYTSPRKEKDQARILSGVFEGRTTGAPISIMIINHDADPSKYEEMKNIFRPGHANYTYLKKYGVFDYRGGGRASARETACRVAAGAIAKKIVAYEGVQIIAYIKQINTVAVQLKEYGDIEQMQELTYRSPIYCPDIQAEKAMMDKLDEAKKEGDSLGGVVEFLAKGVPVGWGDPVYGKLEAKLAHAMMSLPASKGFEIGEGFRSVGMKGSEHNDMFIQTEQGIETSTNYSGGVLGGISNGMPIIGRVAFKPTSSIRRAQQTVTIEGVPSSFMLPEGSRHDPCVAIRAVPVVEAMLALVLADALLLNRCTQL